MDKVVHFEITAANLVRAKKFYQETFDWGITDLPDMNYILIRTAKTDDNGTVSESGAINGGMIAKNGGIISPVLVIQVENIDEKIKQVEKNGGKLISPKKEIPDMSISVYVKDTEGNIIGLWQTLKPNP
jgi:predicted enzyme related to lactoylglutathione lyase